MGLKSLDLKLGFACNNNCLSCPQAHRRHFGDLSIDEIKGFLDKGRRNGDTQVVLTGGEPTVRPDIVEIVRYAKSIGYTDVQLQSNGRMFSYREFCKKIVGAGANSFFLGIHGPRPEIHDFLTRSPGSFNQAVQGIKNLRALSMHVAVNSVINKINYKLLPETAKFFGGLDIQQLQFAFIHCTGNAKENIDLLLPKKSDVKPFLLKALRIGMDAGMRMRVEAMPLCFLEGFEGCSAEIHAPYKEVMDAEGVREDFNKIRMDAKVKGPNCGACRFDPVCIGVWKEYPEKFGWSEFKPVKGEKVTDKTKLFN